jgi:ubiquinone/menaquinone biosynthesis C-methylase UbiE
MTDQSSRAIRLFNELATGYDEALPFFRGFAELHADWLAPAAGTRVLDLGAGTGALTGSFLRRGCEVTAVDAAPAMVARLAGLHPRAHARVMDAQRLDFPDASFDLVSAGFVIHILDDPAAAVAEARRVLRPGGVFSFSTPAGVENTPEWDFYPALFKEFEGFIPEGEGRLSREIDEEELLRQAGFHDLTYIGVEQRLPVPDADTFWAWALSHGSRAFINALPAQKRAEFEERVRAGLAMLEAPITYPAGANLDRGTA